MAGRKEARTERRRQAEEDVISGRQKKAREVTVTDEEVEEFFAILRRIHVAVSYFKNNGHKVTELAGSTRLRAILEGESKEVVNATKGEEAKREEEGVEENVGFDLNADPDPEYDPV